MLLVFTSAGIACCYLSPNTQLLTLMTNCFFKFLLFAKVQRPRSHVILKWTVKYFIGEGNGMKLFFCFFLNSVAQNRNCYYWNLWWVFSFLLPHVFLYYWVFLLCYWRYWKNGSNPYECKLCWSLYYLCLSCCSFQLLASELHKVSLPFSTSKSSDRCKCTEFLGYSPKHTSTKQKKCE